MRSHELLYGLYCEEAEIEVGKEGRSGSEDSFGMKILSGTANIIIRAWTNMTCRMIGRKLFDGPLGLTLWIRAVTGETRIGFEKDF
jgi:hypothetical protein